MKELSIEEKAKRYDEALERAKELLEVELKDTRDKRVVLSFFPELVESEDEWICRKLIAFLKQCKAVYGDGFKQFGLDIDDALAWLEKQGEQDPAWSEEVEAAISLLNHIAKEQEKDHCQHSANALRKAALYLETCRPQSQWKPSKEQMVALDGICSYIRNKADWEISQDIVSDLYKLSEQLKKLKE